MMLSIYHGRSPTASFAQVSGAGVSGKTKIGDAWSAISIIALSQNNPLKAIAKFVENSIDARTKNITIVRGKEQGEQYLRIIDDGEGTPLDERGEPGYTIGARKALIAHPGTELVIR